MFWDTFKRSLPCYKTALRMSIIFPIDLVIGSTPFYFTEHSKTWAFMFRKISKCCNRVSKPLMLSTTLSAQCSILASIDQIKLKSILITESGTIFGTSRNLKDIRKRQSNFDVLQPEDLRILNIFWTRRFMFINQMIHVLQNDELSADLYERRAC